MSSTYRACPVTLSRPSRRGTEVPTMRVFFIRIAESSEFLHRFLRLR
jgi:hypothetical protein